MVIKIIDSFSSVQEKPICTPSCLSEVTLNVAFETVPVFD